MQNLKVKHQLLLRHTTVQQEKYSNSGLLDMLQHKTLELPETLSCLEVVAWHAWMFVQTSILFFLHAMSIILKLIIFLNLKLNHIFNANSSGVFLWHLTSQSKAVFRDELYSELTDT